MIVLKVDSTNLNSIGVAVTKQADKLLLKKIVISASIILSGLCWYFSNGLNGDFWYLLWLSPIPVLFFLF